MKHLIDFLSRLRPKRILLLDHGTPDAAEERYDPSNQPKWAEYLDEEAIDWFANTFDFDSDEGKIYQQLWNLTQPEIRLTHPMFNFPGNWDFESMIDSLFNGQYVFADLVMESAAKGVLYYDPWAGPFGGSESMVALIESFGHTVTVDSWHKGPHHHPIIGWDYELAKKLVVAGKGFMPGCTA